MKTLTLFGLVLMNLCFILGLSNGAALSNVISESDELEIFDLTEDDYNVILEKMFRDSINAITKNSAFDNDIDFESFNQEDTLDVGQTMVSTEDDLLKENVDSGLRCAWKGHDGKCCQTLKIIKVHTTVCISIKILPPADMKLSLTVSGKTIFSKTVGPNKGFNACIKLMKVKMCFNMYDIQVSAHHVKVCLKVSASLLKIKFHKKLGCIEKKFSLNETPLNSAFDNDIDFESFIQEDTLDVGQTMVTTEDDRLGEYVDSGLSCSWKGHDGKCCQRLKIIKVHTTVCISIKILPPADMKLSLTVSGKTIFSKTVGPNKGFDACIKLSKVKMCFNMYDIQVSTHHVKVCLKVSASLLKIKFHKNLGCIEKKFSFNEIPEITRQAYIFNVHNKHSDGLDEPRQYVQNNDVIRFEQ